MQSTSTVIIGAGQAGLALSRSLTLAGHDHVVLERGRLGERWRSERWPSMRLLTPNRLNGLPGAEPLGSPDESVDAAAYAAHLERYAVAKGAPVVEHAEVQHVARAGARFEVDSEAGRWIADSVVVATGHCDVGALPAVAVAAPGGVQQLHSSRYEGAATLAEGGVLVVGAGASGQQIALELREAGRDVVLASGRHARMPRRYRGRDAWSWLGELGRLGREGHELHDLDLGVLHAAGVVVTGRLTGFSGTRASFDARALAEDMAAADAALARRLAAIDEHVTRGFAGAATAVRPVPVTLPRGQEALDLRARGVRTIVWATGYRRSYPWLHVPVLENGEIVHRDGDTPVPGLHVLGMRSQRSRLIGGVGADARLLAARLLAPRVRSTARAALQLAA